MRKDQDAEPLADVPGGWTRRAVRVGAREFALTVPADPDSVLEAAVLSADASGTLALDPYWAALWPAAVPTAEAVLRSDWPGDPHVLEIGCGVGLVGLAALARGLRVTFSDQVPEALAVAVANARDNGFARADALLLDWRHPPRREFAVLLASDVLYQADHHRPLLEAIGNLLAPTGVCWIGDPGRVVARDFLTLAQRTYRVQLFDRDGEPSSVPVVGQFQLIVLRHQAGQAATEPGS